MQTKTLSWLSLLICLFACTSPAPETSQQHVYDSIAQTMEAKPDTVSTLPKSEGLEDRFAINDLFKPENSDVVNALADEDFESAIKKLDHYERDKNLQLTETQLANFRYMRIYALAGLVIAGKKKKLELDLLLEKWEGQDLVTQHLTVTEGNHMPFNQLRVEQDSPKTIEITCANDAGINIHCFVRAKMQRPFDLQPHVGKQGYLCGTLGHHKISDDGVNSWIADLELLEGFVKILEDEFEKSAR